MIFLQDLDGVGGYMSQSHPKLINLQGYLDLINTNNSHYLFSGLKNSHPNNFFIKFVAKIPPTNKMCHLPNPHPFKHHGTILGGQNPQLPPSIPPASTRRGCGRLVWSHASVLAWSQEVFGACRSVSWKVVKLEDVEKKFSEMIFQRHLSIRIVYMLIYGLEWNPPWFRPLWG